MPLTLKDLEKLATEERQRSQFDYDRLVSAAHAVTPELRKHFGLEDVAQYPVLRHDYFTQERERNKLAPSAEEMTQDLEMLLTHTIFLREAKPPQKVYIDSAVRMRDGKAQYALLRDKNPKNLASEPWVGSPQEIAERIELELQLYFAHPHAESIMKGTPIETANLEESER